MVVKGPGFTNGIIILEEPEAIYYSGQLLLGNVHFELNEPVTFSAEQWRYITFKCWQAIVTPLGVGSTGDGDLLPSTGPSVNLLVYDIKTSTSINLACLGEAKVQRTEMQYEMSGGDNRCREVQYEGREQYFNFLQCIYGGTGVSSLPPGVHSIPFQFQVPFNIPSSFKGGDGIILYCITAFLEYPETGRREQLIKEFQVVAPLSPNTLANMMQPLELDFEEIETCNCFCNSKSIDMKIVLPARALHVGSSIPIGVKVRNYSSVEIYEICFKITKRYTFRTQRPRSEYTSPEETLAEMKEGPVLSDTRGEYTWHLPLPLAVLPNLEACSIMDVAYFFKVKIQMTGCNEPVEDESEIFIGVLPQSDSSSVTLPDLVPHLPKAPIPNPNDVSIGIIPAQNYPANVQISQQHAPLIVTLPENAGKSPYEIGFRSQAVPTHPPYPVSNINSGYPYNAVSTSAGSSPYLSGRPLYNLNSSQPNIATAPSAPPL